METWWCHAGPWLTTVNRLFWASDPKLHYLLHCRSWCMFCYMSCGSLAKLSNCSRLTIWKLYYFSPLALKAKIENKYLCSNDFVWRYIVIHTTVWAHVYLAGKLYLIMAKMSYHFCLKNRLCFCYSRIWKVYVDSTRALKFWLFLPLFWPKILWDILLQAIWTKLVYNTERVVEDNQE